MNFTYTNQTMLNLAERILLANYPDEDVTFPVLGNDQMSRFFVSPIMELIIRHVFFLFATAYVQNQATFYSNISMINYYMTPEWIEQRFLYRAWNKYSTRYLNDILFVEYNQVQVGQQWGIMIVNNYDSFNHTGNKETLYPYVTNALWIDWKVKSIGPDYYSNKKIPFPARAPGITRFRKWIEERVKEEYLRAVMATLPF